MLEVMDAGQIAEWQAFARLQDEANTRADLAAKAQQGVKNPKRRRR